MKKYIFQLLGIAIFIFILSKVDFSKIFYIIFNCNKFFLVLTVIFVVIEIFMKAFRWKVILGSANIHITWIESLKIYWIGIFLGSFTPGKVGDFAKVAFIKDKKNSSIFKAIASIVFDRVIDICILAVCSLIAVLFIRRFKWYAIILVLFMTLIFLFFFLILYKASPIRLFFSKFLYKLAPSIHLDFERFSFDKLIDWIKKINKEYLIIITLFVLLSWFSYFLGWFFLSKSLNINIPFTFLISSVAIAALVAIIPISINGIGTRDATIIFMFSQFNIPIELALTYSISILAISLSLNSLGFIPYLTMVRKVLN